MKMRLESIEMAFNASITMPVNNMPAGVPIQPTPLYRLYAMDGRQRHFLIDFMYICVTLVFLWCLNVGIFNMMWNSSVLLISVILNCNFKFNCCIINAVTFGLLRNMACNNRECHSESTGQSHQQSLSFSFHEHCN